MSGKMWIGATALLWLSLAQRPNIEERLTRHRNLGKAFYGNPTTQRQAVEEFRKALEVAPGSVREKLNYGLALIRAGRTSQGIAALQDVQQRDPKLPHTWFNLGLQYKKTGDLKQAIAQFERMIALVPEEAIAHYQLGALYRQEGRLAEARTAFARAAELDPRLAAPRFQLFNIHRQAGRSAEAARYLEEFNRLKKQSEGAVVPEDVEWCAYAEIYDPPTPPSAEVAPATPQFETKALDFAGAAGLVAMDASGSAQTDLLVWQAAEPGSIVTGRARARYRRPHGRPLHRAGRFRQRWPGGPGHPHRRRCIALPQRQGAVCAAPGESSKTPFRPRCLARLRPRLRPRPALAWRVSGPAEK